MRKKELIKKMLELEAINDYHKFYYDSMKDLVKDILVIYPELASNAGLVIYPHDPNVVINWNYTGASASWTARSGSLASKFKVDTIKTAADAIRKKNDDKSNKKKVKDAFDELGLNK